MLIFNKSIVWKHLFCVITKCLHTIDLEQCSQGWCFVNRGWISCETNNTQLPSWNKHQLSKPKSNNWFTLSEIPWRYWCWNIQTRLPVWNSIVWKHLLRVTRKCVHPINLKSQHRLLVCKSIVYVNCLILILDGWCCFQEGELCCGCCTWNSSTLLIYNQ